MYTWVFLVNHSLALIFTSTKITTQIPTFQRLFGDPAVYVDRWASGLRSDLGLSLEGLDSSSTANLFGTLTYDYDRQLVFFTDNRQRSLNYGAYVYTNNTNFYALNPTQVSGQVGLPHPTPSPRKCPSKLLPAATSLAFCGF